MTDEQIEAMLRDLLEEIDHDIAKDYDPETAEDSMADLISIVRSHIG